MGKSGSSFNTGKTTWTLGNVIQDRQLRAAMDKSYRENQQAWKQYNTSPHKLMSQKTWSGSKGGTQKNNYTMPKFGAAVGTTKNNQGGPVNVKDTLGIKDSITIKVNNIPVGAGGLTPTQIKDNERAAKAFAKAQGKIAEMNAKKGQRPGTLSIDGDYSRETFDKMYQNKNKNPYGTNYANPNFRGKATMEDVKAGLAYKDAKGRIYWY